MATAAKKRPAWLRIEVLILPILLLYPFFPVLDWLVHGLAGTSLRLDRQLVNIFIFAILALALNLQVGYAGLLQLGIAAFFAIGAFSTGVLTVENMDQALARTGGGKRDQGAHAAEAVITLAKLKTSL